MLQKSRLDIYLFIIGTLALTLLLNMTKDILWVALAQLTPFILVLIILIFSAKRGHIWRNLGISRLGSWRYYLVALFISIPIVISFLFAWKMGYVGLPPVERLHKFHFASQVERFQVMFFTYLKPTILLAPILFAFAEEVGWRGYLQMRLQETVSVKKAIVYTAIIWAIFHYPFYLNQYNSDGVIWINMLLFTIMILPLSFLLGWLRVKSKSLWPVVICHAMINHLRTFGENFLHTHKSGWSMVAGEHGWITIVGWIVIAYWFWTMNSVDKSSKRGLL